MLDGQLLGYVGQLSAAGQKQSDLRGPATVAELKLAPLVERADLVPQYVPLPAFPAVSRDLNLVVDEAVRWAQMAATVRRNGGPIWRASSIATPIATPSGWARARRVCSSASASARRKARSPASRPTTSATASSPLAARSTGPNCGHRQAGLVALGPPACLLAETVQMTGVAADHKSAAGHGGRGENLAAGVETPDFLARLSIKAVDSPVLRAEKNAVADDDRRAVDHAAGRERPLQAAGLRVKGVQLFVSRSDVDAFGRDGCR